MNLTNINAALYLRHVEYLWTQVFPGHRFSDVFQPAKPDIITEYIHLKPTELSKQHIFNESDPRYGIDAADELFSNKKYD